jgi:hypothetical protein
MSSLLTRPPITIAQPDFEITFGEVGRLISTPFFPLLMDQGLSFQALHSVFVPPGVAPVEGPFNLTFGNLLLSYSIVNNSPTSTLYITLVSLVSDPIVNPDFFTARLAPGETFTNPFPPSLLIASIGLWTDPVVVTGDAQITEVFTLIF